MLQVSVNRILSLAVGPCIKMYDGEDRIHGKGMRPGGVQYQCIPTVTPKLWHLLWQGTLFYSSSLGRLAGSALHTSSEFILLFCSIPYPTHSPTYQRKHTYHEQKAHESPRSKGYQGRPQPPSGAPTSRVWRADGCRPALLRVG